MPWLEEVNPEIDWTTKSIRDRTTGASAAFHQCVRDGVARQAGGRRVRAASRAPSVPTLEDVLLFFSKHAHCSPLGDTKVISFKQLRKMKPEDGEFCFFVNAPTEKATRQLATDWEALRGTPAEPTLLRYKSTVFRTELPATPPTRTKDVEAEIELDDESPIVRKQIRLSEAQKAAVREWTQEMLAAGMIRPSKSAYSSPTFCVKKAVGWRIVHDFRAINARVRTPANPVPRKEDIYDAMSKGKLFSAMDLLWDFFQVRLREQDIPFTAFSTPDGLYEYLQLYVKLSKCVFCVEEIPCLGDYIGRNGVRMDPDKVRAITDWPTPTTTRALQSFLGTCVTQAAIIYASYTGSSRFDRPFHVRMDASDYAVGGYLFQVDDAGKERVIGYGGRKLNNAERMYPTREKELLAALHAMHTWKVYLIDKPFFVDTDHKTLETLLRQSTCSQRLARWLNELSFYQPIFRWIPGETNIVADALSRSAQSTEQPASHVSLSSLLAQLTARADHAHADDEYLQYMRQRPSIIEQCKRLYASDTVFGPLFEHLSSASTSKSPPVALPHGIRSSIAHFFVDNELLYYQPDDALPRRLCVPSDTDLRNSLLFECHDTASRGHPGAHTTLVMLWRVAPG
ncbi:hypothetical protein P43SY_011382 [Pythium insidiosum]|uniref:Reverse transcriptase RNase H-like domain-containing protein n=1 Tax=Pythium insidiosum TaxID=114742 RepID=A0AAD5LSW0_PYTIN|nr:hypothetical protein P43SY_011382 [Pythium insidiosum]